MNVDTSSTAGHDAHRHRRTRVAVVAPYPRTKEAHGEESLGGVASYTKNLVDEMRKSANVTVIAPGDGPFGARHDGDVRVLDVDRSGTHVAKVLKGLARDSSIDAVHVQFEQHLFGGALQNLRLALALRKLKRAKRVLVTVHQVPDLAEVDRAFLQRNGFPPLPMLARAWIKLQYMLLAAACTLVLVHERELAERLFRSYGVKPARVEVVPHGVTLSELPCTREEAKRRLGVEGQTVVLYFGYVTGYKGVDVLAGALERLGPERRASTAVIIAGKVPERKLENSAFRAEVDELESRIRALAPWVQRKGFLSAEDISLHLAAADVVVFPYRNVFGASGPFSITIGHGRPFLASEAFRKLNLPEQSLFETTPEALAAKLERYLDDAGMREALEADARRMAQEVAWPTVAARTVALYRVPLTGRVLLMGAYGQGNLGDEALLEVHLQQLRGMDVVVASTDPAETARRYGVRSVPTYGGMETFRALLDSDAVVFGGGSVMKELPRPYPRHRVVAALAFLSTLGRALGRRVAFSAVGVERLDTRVGRALARQAALAAHVFHVRDEGSRRLLSRIGASERAAVVADAAYLLESDPAADERARELLSGASGRPVVVLNPMCSHETSASVDSVGIAFASLADELQETLDAHVVLLPFKVRGEDSDTAVVDEVMRRVAQPERIVLAPHDLRPAEVLALLRASDFVVGMRHHGVLLALAAGAPLLAVPYAPKTEHLVEEFRLQDFSLRAEDLTPETLREAFRRAHALRDLQIDATRQVLAAMREKAHDNFAGLRHALHTGSA